jgi:FkbM family methyltransferase
LTREITQVDASDRDREFKRKNQEAYSEKNAAVVRIDGVLPFKIMTHDPAGDEYISRQIVEHGQWEPFETEIIRRLLSVFNLFIDLGANIGWYTCIAQHLMRDCSAIYAFEPDPRNLSLLRQNAQAAHHTQTFIVGAALSDTVGRTCLYQSSSNMGDHRLYVSAEERPAVVVPTTTLDVYFGGRVLPPHLVKMDTQGSEPRIFRGGNKTLSNQDRDSAFIIEFWPYGMASAGENIDVYLDHLATFSQRPFIIDRAVERLYPVSWQDLKRRVREDLAPVNQWFVDLVMVTPGSAAFHALDELIAS